LFVNCKAERAPVPQHIFSSPVVPRRSIDWLPPRRCHSRLWTIDDGPTPVPYIIPNSSASALWVRVRHRRRCRTSFTIVKIFNHPSCTAPAPVPYSIPYSSSSALWVRVRHRHRCRTSFTIVKRFSHPSCTAPAPVPYTIPYSSSSALWVRVRHRRRCRTAYHIVEVSDNVRLCD
jgi:hypothetical protein